MSVLLPGLPAPVTSVDSPDSTYWQSTRRHELAVQRCQRCRRFQWGPEWNCHRCLSFELEWASIEPRARVYSWIRVWHPVHPALVHACPYDVVLVELPHADNIRMIGTFTGSSAEPTIGSPVRAVFEDHNDADVPYTLVHWTPELSSTTSGGEPAHSRVRSGVSAARRDS